MTFKVGDRVVVNNFCNEKDWVGLEGEITEIESHAVTIVPDKPIRFTSRPGFLSLNALKFSLVDGFSYEPEDWS